MHAQLRKWDSSVNTRHILSTIADLIDVPPWPKMQYFYSLFNWTHPCVPTLLCVRCLRAILSQMFFYTLIVRHPAFMYRHIIMVKCTPINVT